MSELSIPTTANGPQRHVNASRDAGVTAPGRCLMYALYSDLLGSPFETAPAVAHEDFDVADLALPYSLSNINALVAEWHSADQAALRREYSGLFEVGSDGPPVPIREDLHRNQPAGVREDIVRFYDYFGYGLNESFAWSPDHLSVELEFMHFLCFRESEEQATATGSADPLSFQLAQIDFAERHLCNWVPELATKLQQQQDTKLYGRLVASLSEFLVKDFEWQAGTIQSV